MKPWQLAVVSTLVTLAIGGTYLFTVWRHRHEPTAAETADTRSRIERLDAVAVVRAHFPTSFDDLRALEGKPVWMKNGYTMSYYPYAGGKVEFAKPAGVIPATARLDVKKMIRASAPANAHDGMEPAGPQAFAVFSLAGKPDLYATPVATLTRGSEAYYTDILFFYDDPHTIYDHWPPEVWAAVDAHRAQVGMSELEVRLALGQKSHADGSEVGNRTITYDAGGKHWTVTFVNNRATAVREQ